MPKIQYKEINFRGKSLDLINLVNQVINEYKNQGYELTLRQTYYQLVARGYIPNNERSYKNIGNLINDGRLAGLIDWYSIVDRTRNLRGNNHCFLGIEVKADNGEPSLIQLYHLRKIRESGGYGILLFPKDFEKFKGFNEHKSKSNAWYLSNIEEQKRWKIKLEEKEI